MTLFTLHYKCRIHGWLEESEVDKTTVDFRCGHEGCDLSAIGFPVKDEEVAHA